MLLGREFEYIFILFYQQCKLVRGAVYGSIAFHSKHQTAFDDWHI